MKIHLENKTLKGKTDMEKLKSYFIYQMNVYGNEDEKDINIEMISNIFKDIYRYINEIKLDENNVLLYHNQAYIKGYAYKTIDDVKNEFNKVQIEDKIVWIKWYICELHTTFSNMKKFEFFDSQYKNYSSYLGTLTFIYPFIIKGFKYYSDDKQKLDELFKILEIALLRAKLINSRVNIQEKLNEILMNFVGDVVKLREDIKICLNTSNMQENNMVNLK